MASALEDKTQTISRLEREVELLKSGLDAIVQVFTSTGKDTIGKVPCTRDSLGSNGKAESPEKHVANSKSRLATPTTVSQKSPEKEPGARGRPMDHLASLSSPSPSKPQWLSGPVRCQLPGISLRCKDHVYRSKSCTFLLDVVSWDSLRRNGYEV